MISVGVSTTVSQKLVLLSKNRTRQRQNQSTFELRGVDSHHYTLVTVAYNQVLDRLWITNDVVLFLHPPLVQQVSVPLITQVRCGALLNGHSIFFAKSAEISVVGLQVRSPDEEALESSFKCMQASGKTSFVNVIGSGQVAFIAFTQHFRAKLMLSRSGLRTLYRPSPSTIAKSARAQ